MDQYTRRIVGFGVHRGVVDGVTLCQMFNRAIGRQPAPTYLSSDNDPLYRFHQWKANLRIVRATTYASRHLRLSVAFEKPSSNGGASPIERCGDTAVWLDS
jgi:hypothetical protein